METIFVDSPPIEEDDMSLREIDVVIQSATQHYMEVQGKTKDLLERAEDRLLSGSAGTVYLKKLGHRPLSGADFDSLVNALGTEEDKQALIGFSQAQIDLTQRLKDTRAIGLVVEQAGITRNLFYNRLKQPELWKPEEVIKVIDVLDRLRV